MSDAKQIVLAQRPQGMPKPTDFRLETVPMPKPEHGQALVRVIYLSIDPYMRGRISGVASYAKGVDPGDVMVGGCVGQVIEAKGSSLKPGDFVEGPMGWRSHAVLPASLLRRLDPSAAPISTANGVLGMPGMTAYFALLDVCVPRAGDTVVVSAASGAVGQVVGQIAKIAGCRVVGIAGGAKKCAFVRDELGFDAAVDYKAEKDLGAALKVAAPRGVDVYFDNVGGDILEACLFRMNNHGRISCCGAVSQYDGAAPRHGPRGIPGLIVTKRLKMQGFIVMDYNAEREQALADLQSWVKAGKMKVPEDIIDGIENTPSALIGLLAGDNIGKRMVRVS